MPPKRKAKEVDSSHPTPAPGVRQPRKPKAASQKTYNDSDDDFKVVPKPPAKRSRKPQPRTKQVGWDQDDGLSRSQKSATVEQQLMDQNAKSKEFIQTFRGEVTQGQGNAIQALEQFKHDLDRAHASQQQEIFVGGESLSGVVISTNVKENPLHQQTQQMLRLCRNILRRHQTTERESQRPGLVSPRAAWTEDEQKMVALLQCGRQYGEKLAENLLSPDETNPDNVARRSGDKGSEEAEGLVAGMFEKTKQTAVSDTWGQVAHAQMRALAGVVRTLPVAAKK